MKKTFLLLSLSSNTAIISAQPVLNQVCGFQDGVIIEYFMQINPAPDEGSSGANQTWDFSSLSSSDPSMVFNGVPASTTPFSADFSQATIASSGVDFSGNEIYNYFTNDTSHYLNWGYESNVEKLIYTDPIDIMHYPFTYGDNFNDAYYGTLSLGYNSGTIEKSGDGYGTLILPGGIFFNCLRVREIRNDTLDGDLILTTSSDTSYLFYVANFPEPLCQVNYHHNSNGLNLKEIYWQNVQPSSTEDAGTMNNIALFPNPCKGNIQLMLPFESSNTFIKIIGISGKEISAPITRANNLLSINTSALPEGLYFIDAESNSEKFKCCFFKVR